MRFEPIPPPEVVLPQLGPVIQESVFVEDRTFLIQRPSQSDALSDRAAADAAGALAGYVPYWADLWPAARMLAKVVLQEPWEPGAPVLEIGCGLGLPGLVALSRGLRVTFADHDPSALRFAAANARLNGFTDFDTLQLDWRDPPDGVRTPILLASDVVYESSNVEPLMAFIARTLAPGGMCLLADLERVPGETLRAALTDAGLPYTTQLVRAGEPGGRRFKGTLYRIQRPLAT